MIFKKPTILHGFGEAGAEAAVPLTPFWNKLDEWGQSIVDSNNGAYSGEPATIVLQIDGREVGRIIAPYANEETNRKLKLSQRKLGYI